MARSMEETSEGRAGNGDLDLDLGGDRLWESVWRWFHSASSAGAKASCCATLPSQRSWVRYQSRIEAEPTTTPALGATIE